LRDFHLFIKLFQSKNAAHILAPEQFRARTDVLPNSGPHAGGVLEEVS